MEQEAIITLTAIKNWSYVAAFFASTAYLGLNGESVLILTVLICVDIATGVARSSIVDGPRSIKSSRLAAGTLSKMLLIIVPMVLALAGKGVGIDMQAIAQASITVLILSQAYSIIGNIHSIQTGEEKAEFDAISFILVQIRNSLERYMTVNKPTKK